MFIESLRAMISQRRGVSRRLRHGGQHPWYFGLPLRMRFPRSKLYISVFPCDAVDR